MQKAKISTQTGSSSVRAVTISSNFKFQKVQKLNQIVTQLGSQRRETIHSEGELAAESTSGPRTGAGGMGDQVLQVLKKRIQTNYDHLYSNYPDNKAKILKQIQTVETNISGENAMHQKHEEVIKEKAKYDKLKAIIEEKQRKLRKLLDLKTQFKQSSQPEGSTELTNGERSKLGVMEQKKEETEHSHLIYSEMLKERKTNLLTQSSSSRAITEELALKKEKADRWQVANTKKKQTILKLEQILMKEDQIEIPAGLAQELSSKLQQYENKHSYSNIIKKETLLEEDRFEQLKHEVAMRKQRQRVSKMKKDKQTKEQLSELQTEYALNHMQEHTIKRLYGVQSMQAAIDCDINLDNTDQINCDIEQEIKQFEEANRVIEEQLQGLLIEESEGSQVSVETLEGELRKKEHGVKMVRSQLDRKRPLCNDWKVIMHLINNNELTEQALAQFTRVAMNLNRQQKEQESSDRPRINIKIKLPREDRSEQVDSLSLE